jgi:ABC-2 type transport system permease protein
MPATALLVVGLIAGVRFPGVDGLVVIALIVAGYATVAACWGMIVALRFKTQQAAPLMQVGTFLATLLTTAYAPTALMTGWLGTIADINPVTHLLEGVRQGFIGNTSWATTWHAFAAVIGLVLVLGAFALRSLRRAGV